MLERQGPGRGYYTKPSKSVLIVHPENLETRKYFGVCHNFKVCTGARYLCGYIGDGKSKHDLLKEYTATWEWNICMIRETVGGYPQESYSEVVCVTQLECIFIQLGTWDTGDAFAGVEKIIWENFLLRLFFGKTKLLLLIIGDLSTMLVKKFGLGLLNPVTSVNDKYLSYQRARAELIWAVTGVGAFSNNDQLLALR